MQPTQTLIIKLVDELEEPMPLADVYFDLYFFFGGRFCYGLRSGPTNRRGEIRITYRDAEALREVEAKFNLMDYNTPLDRCDSVKIRIPSADEFKKAFELQDKSLKGDASPEAQKWLKAANYKLSAKEVPVKLVGNEIFASIPCKLK